jgi:hypothetical protein
MAARIQSLRNGIDPVDELSRDDLVIGDVVAVSSLDAATTYDWTLVYVPEGSTATFSGVPTAVSPGSFTVDKVGPYLVRLVVDQGLPGEDTQYVRLRALTTSLGLTLVSAGERRDGTGIIPVDIDATGWADEQNNNLLALEAAIAASTGTLGTLSYNKNIPEIPNDSVSYRGWVSVACTMIGVRVRMMNVHTVGNFDLEVVNEGTGNTVLAVDPTSLNTLVDGVIQPIALTANPADLAFSALDGWRVTFTSDDPDFDGSDIYFELVWNTATAGGPVVEDLATTLLVGNITGGSNIIVTNGDEIRGQAAPAASGLDGFDLVLRGGAGDGAGVQGAVVVDGKLTVTGVIDPTAIIFTQDPGTDAVTAAAEGAIFVSSGALSRQRDTPYFVPESAGNPILMIGGNVLQPTVAVNTATSLDRSTSFFSPAINAGATLDATLPAADTMQGRILYFEHRGDASGTFNIDADGADTIDGLGTPTTLAYGTLIALISDGFGNWRTLNLGGGSANPFIHKNVTPLPSNTWRYDGWAPFDGTVQNIRVYMATKHTTGPATYEATFTNEATGQTMLTGATFDMDALTAGTVTDLTLTGVPADLAFSAKDEWSVEFASTDPGFDGDGIYFELVWAADPASGGVPLPAPNDSDQFPMAVSPNNVVLQTFFAPYDLTVVEINVYCESGASSALGVYTLAVDDIDLANNLLSAATFDMETPNLPAATLTVVPLTGVAANLDLAKGTRVRFTLTSDNADLVASGLYLQIIYRSQ